MVRTAFIRGRWQQAMKRICYLIILLGFSSVFAQNKVQRIVEFSSVYDSLNNKTVKTFTYDKNGKLIKEDFLNFQPLSSKYRNTGTWIYEYVNNRIKKSYKINSPKNDTIVMDYRYSGNSTHITTEELITRSKVQDSVADKYGIDREYGCVIAEEHLDFYKVWVKKEEKKIIHRNGKVIKEKVYFDHKTNPHNLVYEYDEKGRLLKLEEINRRTKRVNWVETYVYKDNSVIRKREYFVEYWGEIPPIELEKKFYNDQGKLSRLELTNSKDFVDGIVEYKYQNGVILNEIFYDSSGKRIREHRYYY